MRGAMLRFIDRWLMPCCQSLVMSGSRPSVPHQVVGVASRDVSARPDDSGEDFARGLLVKHGPALHRYVSNLLSGDRYRTEDIVQETMLKAWQNERSLTVETARPWLFRVARNLAMD